MSNPLIKHLSAGTFVFLKADANEIRRLIPNSADMLPAPQRIYLEDESEAPLMGYPILRSRASIRLEKALQAYLHSEEEVALAFHTKSAFDSKAHAGAWETYHAQLAKIVENTTVSSLGYDYAAIFWLEHSLAVARHTAEIPKRLRRRDLVAGRDHGDALKYKVIGKWLDRVTTLMTTTTTRLANEMGETAEALFPPLLDLLRDNLLALSEDYISSDLTELSSYFNGSLAIDGRDFRQRLRALDQWHDDLISSDRQLQSAVRDLMDADLDGDTRRFLHAHGYVRFLSRHPAYDTSRFFSPAQVDTWEQLLDRIKVFEILHSLRKMLVSLEVEDGKLVCRDRSINTTWVGGPPVLKLSSATRPIDFAAPWVVNPVVHRFGLVYDITDFSATISLLGRAEKTALEDAFRMTANLQRKINNLADNLNLRLEKYLGDGAFYSGRYPRRLLDMAIHLQRLYPKFVDDGYPFDRGLRIALNFGEYRLLPLASDRGQAPRYEFFGHGLVELSRLSTGKKTQEIDAFKNYLISQGYPEAPVDKFFAPMQRRNAELVSRIDEARRFYAYINQTGTLINEGIVATEAFINRLGSFHKLYYARQQGRGFIAVPLRRQDQEILVGIRKLGIGKFKGLDPLPIYEVVDGLDWDMSEVKEIAGKSLLASLEHLFTQTVTAANQRPKSTPTS